MDSYHFLTYIIGSDIGVGLRIVSRKKNEIRVSMMSRNVFLMEVCYMLCKVQA